MVVFRKRRRTLFYNFIDRNNNKTEFVLRFDMKKRTLYQRDVRLRRIHCIFESIICWRTCSVNLFLDTDLEMGNNEFLMKICLQISYMHGMLTCVIIVPFCDERR